MLRGQHVGHLARLWIISTAWTASGGFDLIHDLPNPALGLRTLKQSMAQDGMFLLMDIEATEDPVDNSGPYGVFKLGISLHFCMTTSMWQGGEGMGTVGLSDSVLRNLCTEVHNMAGATNSTGRKVREKIIQLALPYWMWVL